VNLPAHKRIIFALDYPSLKPALKAAKLLKDSVGLFKVGLELFVKEGPPAIKALKKAAPGCGIFLDLKFHDIPATVAGACSSAANTGADMLTIHLEDPAAAEAAVSAVKEAGAKTIVLGVTVLTSLGSVDLKRGGLSDKYQDPSKLVILRARSARRAGLGGLICSPMEAKAVRRAVGKEMVIVTPGIRLASSSQDDQKRVSTPGGAIKNGADYIVVGRPIRDAKDPIEAARAIAREINP
jgi:orotidine-5'-phosphate decarboxylase